MENRINQMKKTGARLLIICLVLLLLIPAATTESYGNATDTLTFKIGYYGWSPEDYVEKKTFKVSEIQSLSSGNMLAYTYYDRSGKRVGIDSAYGAKLNTLLDKAGIDKGSINALAFYTTDSGNGAFATFTWQELVLTDRYYFDNLAAASTKTENMWTVRQSRNFGTMRRKWMWFWHIRIAGNGILPDRKEPNPAAVGCRRQTVFGSASASPIRWIIGHSNRPKWWRHLRDVLRHTEIDGGSEQSGGESRIQAQAEGNGSGSRRCAAAEGAGENDLFFQR